MLLLYAHALGIDTVCVGNFPFVLACVWGLFIVGRVHRARLHSMFGSLRVMIDGVYLRAGITDSGSWKYLRMRPHVTMVGVSFVLGHYGGSKYAILIIMASTAGVGKTFKWWASPGTHHCTSQVCPTDSWSLRWESHGVST